MTADAAQRFDQVAAQLDGEMRQLGGRKAAQIIGRIDAPKQGVSGDVGHGGLFCCGAILRGAEVNRQSAESHRLRP
jgi:hypothetical protein